MNGTTASLLHLSSSLNEKHTDDLLDKIKRVIMSTYRPLEVTIISANDLKNVNLLSRLEVYAVATISGDPRTRHRTHADHEGRQNPSWNCTLRFSLPDSADTSRLTLDIALRSRRFLLGDRLVGSVHVPVRDLEPDPSQPRFVSYQVVRPSGKGKGVLNFSYKFGEAVSGPRAVEPVTAYPAYHVTEYSGYPCYPPAAGYSRYPPPTGCGYDAPQLGPAGYGYTLPQGYGYGAQPPEATRPRGRKFGMGLGAGLLGGALGGMLLGDMVSDAFDDGGQHY